MAIAQIELANLIDAGRGSGEIEVRFQALGSGPGSQGDAKRDGVQPTAHSVALSNGSSLARQSQKGSLKGILDIVDIAQYAAAHASTSL
jgi:hypothetical protein